MTVLDRYLARIGLASPIPLAPEGLAAVVAAHRHAIPFENLAIPMGEGIRLDPESIASKLIDRRRGGYCFEQNGLLLAMLRELGFTARPLLARVRLGLPDDVTPPRTHVLLLVTIAGEEWIADAGFGGSFVPPLRLVADAQAATPDGVEHRLQAIGKPGSAEGEWLLQRRSAGEAHWTGQYSFDLAHVAADDLEQANHWTATRPGTRFTSNVIASRVLPEGMVALTGRQVSIHRSGEVERHEIASPEALRLALADRFGIAISGAEAERLFAFAGE